MPALSEGDRSTDSGGSELIDVEGRIAPERVQFLCSWARESFKATAPALTDALHKLATLCSALAVAVAAWVEKDLIPHWARAGSVGLLIVAVAIAMSGAVPHGRFVALNNPDDVLAFELGVIRRKRQAIIGSGIALLAALLVTFAGLVWRS